MILFKVYEGSEFIGYIHKDIHYTDKGTNFEFTYRIQTQFGKTLHEIRYKSEVRINAYKLYKEFIKSIGYTIKIVKTGPVGPKGHDTFTILADKDLVSI